MLAKQLRAGKSKYVIVFAMEKFLARRHNGEKKGGDSDDLGLAVINAPAVKPKKKKPSLYRVLLLNDDYTPMEFVVYLLENVFRKSHEEAVKIMLHVHHNGVGVCGVYTYEVAETKVVRVMSLARRAQHPLQCTMEKE